MRKILLLMFLIVFSNFCFASLVDLYDTPTSSTSYTNKIGALITITNSSIGYITQITKDGGCTGTICYVYDTDGVLLDQGNFIGDNCVLNASVSSGNSYYALIDKGGASFNLRYKLAPSYPYIRSHSTMIARGYKIGAVFGNDTTEYDNLISINFSKKIIPSSPIDINLTITPNPVYWDSNNITCNYNITGAITYYSNISINDVFLNGNITTVYYTNYNATDNVTCFVTGINATFNTTINETLTIQPPSLDYLNIINYSSIYPQDLILNYSITHPSNSTIEWIVDGSVIKSGNLTIFNTTEYIDSYLGKELYCRINISIINQSYTSSNITNSLTIGQIINFTAQNKSGANIHNFSITYSQGNFIANGTNLIIYNWNTSEEYYFTHPLYANSSVNLITNITYQEYTFIEFTTNSINFTFIDEETKLVINFTTVNFELIGNLFAQNYSTTTGYSYIDLITPESYTIRYQATNYQQRFYYFQLINKTTNSLTLYLLNSSSITDQVTITIIDQSNNFLEDYFVKVMKYNINTNSYEIMEILQTNFEGEVTANIILNTEFYQFIIEDDTNTVVKITSPSYITKNSLTIPVQLGESVAINFHNEQDVTDDLTFNNATNNFRYTYTDSNNILAQACMKVYKVSAFGDTLLDTTCISSSSGTILTGVAQVNGTTYRADAFIYWDAEESFRGSKFKTFDESNVFRKIGLFVISIMMLVFFFMGIWKPQIGLILFPLPLFFGKFMGFIQLDYGVLISIEAIFIIIAYLISRGFNR